MSNVEWTNQHREARIDTYEKELEAASEHYIAKVLEIAARARREMLIPYLKLNRLEFMTGNGAYLIHDQSKVRYLPNGGRDWRNYDSDMTNNLPDWLDRLLRLEVEGTPGNPELALWMLDYTTRKTKNGGGIKE